MLCLGAQQHCVSTGGLEMESTGQAQPGQIRAPLSLPPLMQQSSVALTQASVLQVEVSLPPPSAKEKEGSILNGRRVSAQPERSSWPLRDFKEESGDRVPFSSLPARLSQRPRTCRRPGQVTRLPSPIRLLEETVSNPPPMECSSPCAP